MKSLQIRKKVALKLSAIESRKGLYAVISKSPDYNDVNQEVIRFLTRTKGRSGVYVTLMRPHCDTMERLRDAKIRTKDLFFIDDLEYGGGCKARNCVFIGDKYSLTALSLAMSEVCKDRPVDFIFFDSLNAPLIYEKLEIVERFIHFLVNKSKNLGLLMIIMYAEEPNTKVGSMLDQFCDGCIRI